MLKLDYSYNLSIESSYIITIKNHPISEKMSARCQQSLAALKMPYKVWDAFDGTSGSIKVPDHAKDKSWVSWIKWVDKELSITEVSAALSHISLWIHCIEIDRPIIVLEHDAIVCRELFDHPVIGCIHYLGSIEQAKKGMEFKIYADEDEIGSCTFEGETIKQASEKVQSKLKND